MAIVTQVRKKITMDIWDIVKFQISMYCHLQDISVSDADINCLALLAITGESELGNFCDIVVNKKIFASTQSVRNALAKAEKKKLVVKQGKSKKKISVNPGMNVQTSGSILLDYKIARIES